jgi:hypothetical protein
LDDKGCACQQRPLAAAKILVAYLPTLAIGWLYLIIFALLQTCQID